MAAYFLDTSTVLKRYVQETGTAWVQALAAPAARHSLFVVRITLAETVAAITRRERGGTITPQDAATALADFQLDFARQYRIVEVSAGLVAQAATLARKHALRGYDAVQLAARSGNPCHRSVADAALGRRRAQRRRPGRRAVGR